LLSLRWIDAAHRSDQARVSTLGDLIVKIEVEMGGVATANRIHRRRARCK
jgi:hypothetical protein